MEVVFKSWKPQSSIFVNTIFHIWKKVQNKIEEGSSILSYPILNYRTLHINDGRLAGLFINDGDAQ